MRLNVCEYEHDPIVFTGICDCPLCAALEDKVSAEARIGDLEHEVAALNEALDNYEKA